MSWTPALTGRDAERARAIVRAIAVELSTREVVLPSFGYGLAGLAVFHAYRALAGVNGADETAGACIGAAMESVATEPGPWLFMGYAGIGFALQQVAPIAGDVSEALDQVDAMIASELVAPAWAPYELIGGMTGVGVYALERGSAALRARVIQHLAATRDHGVWRTFDHPSQPSAAATPDGYFNLGLAHGVAGAVTFLADAGERELVVDAFAWLRARELAGVVPCMPMILGAEPAPFTLDGWCYGEPASAIAYVRAGRALGEPALLEAGRMLATTSARRSDAELAHVSIDDALCHGTTGRAHLFQRLALLLDSEELHAAAHRWYARALDRLEAPGALAAIAKPGVQLGLAGIGLALLAATEARDPAWDRAFLVSAAGPEPATAGRES